jgi:RNA recognition motif.
MDEEVNEEEEEDAVEEEEEQPAKKDKKDKKKKNKNKENVEETEDTIPLESQSSLRNSALYDFGDKPKTQKEIMNAKKFHKANFLQSRFKKMMQTKDETYEIIVTNFNKETTTEEQLKDFFSGSGEVLNVSLNKEEGKAIVQFEDAEGLMNALDLNEIKWNGTFLNIKKNTEKGIPNPNKDDKAEFTRTIFVGNISPVTTEIALRKFFEPCGPIEQVRFHYTNDGKVYFSLNYLNF